MIGLFDTERREISYAGTLADHSATGLFCESGLGRRLQIIKKTHTLRFGKGLLGGLQSQHLDIEAANGLGVVQILQFGEGFFELQIKRLIGISLNVRTPHPRTYICLNFQDIFDRVVEISEAA